MAQLQFDQYATGDESEAGPSSSQQRFKPCRGILHVTLRRDHNNTVRGDPTKARLMAMVLLLLF